ncbi:MAG: hypothetical protein SGI92_24660 [Bryobacteraceae bacterium]|nr:hypothetical protein [Bryobacteraceae bacterium]
MNYSTALFTVAGGAHDSLRLKCVKQLGIPILKARVDAQDINLSALESLQKHFDILPESFVATLLADRHTPIAFDLD